tara:strand:- start:23034 stop:23843 length:810 start_codon:yes stop_codon:yes gene_type:complete
MNKNKIYIRLKGGFGNQLFIYAFAIYCKRYFGCDILIDNYTGYVKDVYGRKPMLEMIGIKFKKTNVLQNFYITLCRKLVFGKITYLNLEKDPDIIFNDKEFENKNLYIEGYFQNVKYFNKIKKTIFQKINLDLIDLKNNYKKKINPLIDVCLHHRTTDYNFVIESLFFEKAFEKIENKINKPKYYVFSESIEVSKKYFSTFNDKEFIFVQNMSDLEDFKLMTFFKNYILTIGTFGIWAALLSNKKNKIILKPKKNATNNGAFPLESISI